MYERVILWATPAFFALIGIELLAARLRHRRAYSLADAISSIDIGALSTYLGLFTGIINFGIYVAVWSRARAFTLAADQVWVWASGLLLYDFLYYWYHRAGHEINLLWAAHVVHHQSEEFNLSTALRQTSAGFLFSWVFYLPMAVLGYPPQVFLLISLIDLLYQFWIHTEQIGSLGAFDRIFASPSNHRVHHGANDEYVDRNYGGILILWDRLFGSFQPELRAVPVVYGTRDPLRSWNPLWANLHTYWTLALDSYRAQDWADKLRVWIRRPGWRPPDVAARFPKPAFRLECFDKYRPPISRSRAIHCALQSVAVLALGSRFLLTAPQHSNVFDAVFLAFLAASFWGIGNLLDGGPTSGWSEAGRLMALAAAAFAII